MSYKEDYGLDSFARSRLLALLGFEDSSGRKVSDILRLNKELCYFQYLTKMDDIDFFSFNLGAVSDEIRETVDDFVEYGLVEQNQGGKYILTADGTVAEKEISHDLTPEEKKILKFSKEQLNDLTDEEVLGFMYFLLPKTAEHSKVIGGITKNKEKIIRSLYEKGKISAKTAANWLGISKREVLDKFGLQMGV